jgi:hypothetical protein
MNKRENPHYLILIFLAATLANLLCIITLLLLYKKTRIKSIFGNTLATMEEKKLGELISIKFSLYSLNYCFCYFTKVSLCQSPKVLFSVSEHTAKYPIPRTAIFGILTFPPSLYLGRILLN